MGQWIAKYDVVTRLLSFAAAVVLWFLVMAATNPEKTVEYSGIKLTLKGEEQMQNAYDLSVIEGGDTTLNVKITGKNDVMSKLATGLIVAQVDLSKIATAGEYDLSYTVSLPTNEVKLASKRPDTIRIKVDRVVSKKIQVESVPIGMPEKDYYYGEVQLGVETITITGPKAEVDMVKYAQVQPKLDKITQSYQADLEYILVDEGGEPVTSPYITRDTKTISVTVPVYKIKDVPLEIVESPTISPSLKNAAIVLEPKSVKVYGEAVDIDVLEKIIVGTLDLTTAYSGQVFTFNIPYPARIRPLSDKDKTMTVTVSFDGMADQEIMLSNLHINKLGDDNEEYTITAAATSLFINVQGEEAEIAKLLPDEIDVFIDVDVGVLGEGVHTVPVRIEMPTTTTVTVIGSYEFTIEVTKN